MISCASHHFRIAVTACGALLLSGCRTTQLPRLYSPGSAGYQRANALQFDPYPLDDVAPPVAGGRPHEYERPIPEVKRGQAYTPKRPATPPALMPSFTMPAAPVITAPPALPTIAPAAPFTAPPMNVPYQTLPPSLPTSSSMVRPPY